MVYNYFDIKAIRDDLYNLVNHIENSIVVSFDVKNTAREMKPYIAEYDKLLKTIGITGSVSDEEYINSFKKTQNLINALKNQNI